jgi:hypothetical protein
MPKYRPKPKRPVCKPKPKSKAKVKRIVAQDS